MFGEKYIKKKQVTILNNAIDLNKYAYAKDVRDVVRKKNKLEDEFVCRKTVLSKKYVLFD